MTGIRVRPPAVAPYAARMTGARMHADEVMTDAAQVGRLLAAQFPRWADLPVTRVRSIGTDNAIYRIGDDLAARLPRVARAVGQIAFEDEWLPRLAPYLPVAVPETVAVGEPGEGYPWPWAVTRWLDGVNPADDTADTVDLATDLGRFVAALHRVDPAGAPTAARGQPLRTRDAWVREWTPKAAGLIDTSAVLAAWEAALAVPDWDGPGVWTHGDLLAGNVLVRDGRLSAVIDFGTAGVGDPASDAGTAWELLSAGTREVFRAEAGFDDATWARGRGRVIAPAISGLTYYRDTNPPMAEMARRALNAVLYE